MPFRADYTFVDNNGAKAQMRVWFAGTFDQAASAANALAAVLSSISSAHILSLTVSQTTVTTGLPAAQPSSNVKRVGLLFYRNGDETSSFYLPSIAGLPADTSGPYVGRRITRGTLGVSGLLESVDGLLFGTIDPTGRPYGSTFSVGIITGEA